MVEFRLWITKHSSHTIELSWNAANCNSRSTVVERITKCDTDKLAKTSARTSPGHQGVNKTESLLIEKVRFPRIYAMVGKLLDECIACTASYDPDAKRAASNDITTIQEMVTYMCRFLLYTAIRRVSTC